MITSTPILTAPAVLYWYKTVRNPKAPGDAELVPQLIHNRSGAGSDVLRRRPERRWKDGYRDLDQERNVYLLGNPGRAGKTCRQAR
jgi:hypothetical protein